MIAIVSGVTVQRTASTATPAWAASISPRAKTGSRGQLGWKRVTVSICATNRTAARCPAATAWVSASRCFAPRWVGASGEAGHATLVEGHALDLHITSLPSDLVGKVQTGVAEGLLGPHCVRQKAQPAVPDIGEGQAIGHLGIQVDHRAVLFHGEQRPAGLAARLAVPLAPDLGAGQEQFSQPSGVGNMAPLRLPLQLHQGDEAVGPGEKAALAYIRIRNHRSSCQHRSKRGMGFWPMPETV